MERPLTRVVMHFDVSQSLASPSRERGNARWPVEMLKMPGEGALHAHNYARKSPGSRSRCMMPASAPDYGMLSLSKHAHAS